MSGATIANEIRAIAAGLAGKKKVKFVQVKDLMLDTEASSSRRPRRRTGTRDTDAIDADRAAAESYYKAWSRSIKTKAKEIEEGKIKSPGYKPKSKSRPRSTRNSPRRP